MRKNRKRLFIVAALVLLLLFALDIAYQGKAYQLLQSIFRGIQQSVDGRFPSDSPVAAKSPEEWTISDRILLGARAEVERGTRYDASYAAMVYPEGDVDPAVGACTDVVIRALRHAGFDLQQLIHEDMRDRFAEYPQRWGLTQPDPNIDHRRVHNQMTFFERHGESLPVEVEGQLELWQWGDVVCWRFADGSLHTGIISDRTTAQGIPLVIHNASITKEENVLQRWEIIGHYRFPRL